MAKVVAVCMSEKKGVKKKEVPYVDIKKGEGMMLWLDRTL